jgi:hypothetical protein
MPGCNNERGSHPVAGFNAAELPRTAPLDEEIWAKGLTFSGAGMKHSLGKGPLIRAR